MDKSKWANVYKEMPANTSTKTRITKVFAQNVNWTYIKYLQLKY